jgi:hypothetical protein
VDVNLKTILHLFLLTSHKMCRPRSHNRAIGGPINFPAQVCLGCIRAKWVRSGQWLGLVRPPPSPSRLLDYLPPRLLPNPGPSLTLSWINFPSTDLARDFRPHLDGQPTRTFNPPSENPSRTFRISFTLNSFSRISFSSNRSQEIQFEIVMHFFSKICFMI